MSDADAAGGTPTEPPPRPSPGGRAGVVVTGAASGIGRACALTLAERGRPVACWDLDGDGAATAAAEAERLGVAATSAGVDVTGDGFADLVSATRGALGPVGGLVHAAGIAAHGGIEKITADDWDRVQAVNLRALALLFRDLLGELTAAGPGSAVVAVSSVEGLTGTAASPAYSASKAGLLGLVRSLAHRGSFAGVRVNAVCPGAVDTPMLAPVTEIADFRRYLLERIPLQRFADPAEVARVVAFLCSDDASYVTGAHLPVDGGMVAVT